VSYRVYLAAVAERHVRAIAAWWAENRPNAPSMFERELSAGLDRIAEVPPPSSDSSAAPLDHRLPKTASPARLMAA
jgi:hypothetical protein